MSEIDCDAASRAVSISAQVSDGRGEAMGGVPQASAEDCGAILCAAHDFSGATTDNDPSRALSTQTDESASAEAPRGSRLILHLKRPVAMGTVRQSFSRGRSKAVLVEKIRRRPAPPSAEPQLPAPGAVHCDGGERAETALSEPLATSPARVVPIAAAQNVPTAGHIGPAKGRAGSKTARLSSTIPPPVASRGLLTENAVAARLGLSPATLRNWRVNGLGPPFVRLSRRAVRYEAEVVDEWIASRARRSTSDKGDNNG